MSKSIFIIDTPNCCGECPMSGTGVCRKWSMKDASNFPKNCPLKEIPIRKDLGELEKYSIGEDYIWSEGYNYCIDEILKKCD